MPLTLSTPPATEPAPLVESTALRILDALLAADPVVTRECFSAALRDDAEFVRWTRGRAEAAGEASGSTEDLANWLVRHAPDEFPDLANRLRRVREIEDRHAETLEREKLAALAEFAAGAGHEVNNPLAVICGRAELLLRHEEHPEHRRDLAVIHAQAMRVHEMIADLMLFARPPQPHRERVDIAQVVDELIAELGPQCAEQEIDLRHRIDQRPLSTMADRVQLLVALRAICENALEVLGRGQHLEVAARRAEGPTDSVELVIEDSGPGIDDEVRRHLFDPFYSGRSAGRGLGMGLPKCWRIVTNHGGYIRVDSRPGEGAAFTITLPAADVEDRA